MDGHNNWHSQVHAAARCGLTSLELFCDTEREATADGS